MMTVGSAGAAIMTGDLDQTVGPNENFFVDLDGDGTDDFEFLHTTSFTGTAGYNNVRGAEPGNSIFITSSSSYARAFRGSESVTAGGSLASSALLAYMAFSSTTAGGNFGGSTPRYLGLRFNTTDFGVVNGWMRVSVPNSSFMQLHDWAFESNGGAIHVPDEIPEPSTISLMAAGAAGLALLRRRRKKRS